MLGETSSKYWDFESSSTLHDAINWTFKIIGRKNASKVMTPPFVGALLNNVCVYVYGLTYWMVPLVSSVLLVGLA